MKIRISLKYFVSYCSSYDYSDAYVHVKGTITVNNTAAADANANNMLFA